MRNERQFDAKHSQKLKEKKGFNGALQDVSLLKALQTYYDTTPLCLNKSPKKSSCSMMMILKYNIQQ